MGEILLYAFPLEAYEADLVRRKSLLSDDTKFPDLINEELSCSTAFYWRDLMSMGERICGRILEFISMLWGRRASEKMDGAYLYNWSCARSA